MSDSLYDEISDQQRRQFIDGEQVRTAWLAAERRAVNYRGSMYWQQSKGHAYLYRETSKDQRKSVGPRTPETKKIHAEFKSGKAAAEQRVRSVGARLLWTYRRARCQCCGVSMGAHVGLKTEYGHCEQLVLRRSLPSAVHRLQSRGSFFVHGRRGQIQGNECESLIDYRSMPGTTF